MSAWFAFWLGATWGSIVTTFAIAIMLRRRAASGGNAGSRS